MFKKIIKYKAVSLMCLGGFALVLGGTLWAYFTLRNAAGPLIVHYNDFQGINQVGSVNSILKLGGLGLVAVILNSVISLELERRDKFLGKMLAGGSLLVGILIFIGFAAIISVN